MNMIRTLCVSVATLAALSACSGASRSMSFDGPPAMSAPELLQLLTSDGHFDFVDADGAAATMQFSRDGSVVAAGPGGERRGRWRIASDRYCLAWQSGGAGERCYRARRTGDGVHALTGLDGAAAGTLTIRR
ncbi:MAG: hypothetical protein KDH17_05740 [Rhodocyclaceae bacterium]|nr:hypothetical protein [Rhodocyclaceae bacterium]